MFNTHNTLLVVLQHYFHSVWNYRMSQRTSQAVRSNLHVGLYLKNKVNKNRANYQFTCILTDHFLKLVIFPVIFNPFIDAVNRMSRLQPFKKSLFDSVNSFGIKYFIFIVYFLQFSDSSCCIKGLGRLERFFCDDCWVQVGLLSLNFHHFVKKDSIFILDNCSSCYKMLFFIQIKSLLLSLFFSCLARLRKKVGISGLELSIEGLTFIMLLICF